VFCEAEQNPLQLFVIGLILEFINILFLLFALYYELNSYKMIY